MLLDTGYVIVKDRFFLATLPQTLNMPFSVFIVTLYDNDMR